MHSKKFKFLFCVYVAIFVSLLLVSMLALIDRSKGSEIENYAYGASAKYEIELNTIKTKNVEACQAIAKNTLQQFDQFLGSLNKVVIHSDTSLRRGLANANVIYIRCLPDLEEFLNVLVHEIGHVIDLGYLVAEKPNDANSEFKDFANYVKVSDPSYGFYSISWQSNTDHNKRVAPKDFVSIYSSTDPFEDFAESFMLYVRYPEKLALYAQESPYIMRKYQFIRDNLFEQSVDMTAVSLASFELEQNRVYDATQIHAIY